jgi:hypothetical protein
MVLLKAILHSVTIILSQGPTQQHPGGPGRPGGPNGGPPNARPPEPQIIGAEAPEPSIEDIDAARTREITAKAITGIILLMLKWFKISRKRYLLVGLDGLDLPWLTNPVQTS